MKNNKKMILKTKDEKRRLAFAKRNAKKERNVAEYGAAGGSALVVAKTADFNRRFIAAFLALVFAISCLVVGVNFATKAEDDPYRMQTKEENGLVVSKGLKNNGNGTYDLKLEAYATGKTTTQTLDTDVPLDIVLVLDQSGSMLTKDIYGGNKAIEKTFSIQDIEENEYYYDDNGTLYRVKVDHTSDDVYLPATDENGNTIDTWTAQSAADVTNRLGRLAFKNGSSYEPVYYDKTTKFKTRSSNSFSVDNFSREWWTDNIQETGYYTYVVNDNGDSYWHYIYVCEDGYLFDAYYFTFYYYTESVYGNTLTRTKTLKGKRAGQTAGDVTLLNNYQSLKCYSAGVDADTYTHTAGDGKLYVANGTSNINNYLFTSNDNGNNYIRVLACQKPDSDTSNDYSGNLFAKGYRLYYEKDGQQIPLTDPVLNSTELEYTGTLYEKTINTRLDTLKDAAKQFVEQVGNRAAETGADHRVAVVGFANNEIPSSSTTRNNIVDVDNGASEFITTNTGIFINGNFKSFMTPNLNSDMTRLEDPPYNNITYFITQNGVYVPARQNTFDGSTAYRYMAQDPDKDTGEYYWWTYNTSQKYHYYPAITTLTPQDYKDALVTVNTNDTVNVNHVNDSIDTAIDKLDAYGGTYMSYGLAMAQDVFKYNSNTQSDGTTRKRIVVVFTDGQPGAGGDTWDTAAANEALATAAKLKGQYEASVYTVGLYPDNPGSEVTSFLTALSSKSFTSTTNVLGSVAENNHSATYYFDDDNGLSHSVTWLRNSYRQGGQNYPTYPKWTNTLVGNRTIPVTSDSAGTQQQSEWVDSNGWLRGAKWNANDTRTGADDNIWQFYSVSDPVEQSGNYSFSASNATELNGIFTTISEAIQTPTTTVSLTGDAVLKDIVSDNFIRPENPTVTVQTFGGTYGTGGNIDFNTSPSSTNPQEISVSWGSGEEDSKTLSVTGFDYSDKYIASGHAGEKIVVNISGIILKKGVVSKEVDEQGFMKIYSNDPASGIYNNASNNVAFANFPMPYAPVDPYATEKNGMILSKRISLSDTDTSYNLKLDAFSTGQTFTEQIPTDYVLVVDQSGSMKEDDVPVEYSEDGTTKDWKVSDGAEPYYYKEVDSNGTTHYYRVYQKRGDMFEYHAKDTVYTGDCVDNLSWFQSEEVQELGAASQYWYNPSLDDSGSREGNATDNNMYPVRISSQGAALTYWIRFQFTDAKGTTYKLKYPNQPYYKSPTGGLFGPGDRWGLVISYNLANSTCKGLSGNNNERYTYGQFLGINTGMYVRQVLFTRHPGYNQLAYKDDNGVEHLLIDATYCNSAGNPVGGSCDENGKPSENHTSKNEAYWNGTLYKATRTTTRLNALKMAMTEFVETVAAQNVGHRVAVAGFSSRTGYDNTELLTGTNLTIQNNNGIQYDNLKTEDYQNALLDVTQTDNVVLTDGKLSRGKLKDAIDALTYNGGTEGQYGLYMAKNILDNRSVTTFTPQGSSTPMDRLKIVVYFTDGTPGNYEYDNQYDYGNKVVDAAARIKTSPSLMDTEIYSIGTFGFSDADPLMYQKYSGTNKEYQYDPDYVETINGTWGDRFMYRIWLRNTKGYGDVATDTVSDYMRTITSEYPGASKFVDASWYGTGTKSDNGVYTDMIDRVRGSASGGRHYFLCTDLTGLSRVFKTVASESASTSEPLGTTTIFRDTIDGKNFDYSNAQVQAVSREVDVDGKDYGPGTTTPTLTVKKWQWSDGTDDHPISEDGVVEVTGFDYTGKAATAGNRGEKLLVTISGLIPKGDAVGDKVYSNTSQSGIYAPQAGASDKQIAPFAMPFIERHSYSLTVGSQNKDATFAVTTKLVRADGHDVDSSDSDALNKVVLVSPGTNGTRSKYSSPLNFTGMGNEVPAFYYENVPEGYKVQTGISTNDAEYTYYLTYDDEDASKERALSATSETNNFTFDDHQLHIRSEANTKKVTLKETVTGDFAVPDDLFSPIVHLVPPAGVTAPQTKVYGDYEWKKDENENWMTTTLGEIQGDNADSIVFDVPTGWSIVISNAENDRYQTVSFTVNGGEPVAGGSYTYMIPSNLDNSTIVINNSANNIPVTGINENESGNMLRYILAAVVVFATGAAGIYVYRRKRSVVER